MTADEIRKELAIDHPVEHILTEIAAQLAELNEQLKKTATVVESRSAFDLIFGKL